MASIGNVGSSSQLVEVRRITANDLKNATVARIGPVVPTKPGELPGVGSTAASPLLATNDDQQATAKAEDKKQEAFARMKFALLAQSGIDS